MIEQTIGFIGAGQMARALAGGFVGAGLVRASQLVATDPSESACNQFSDQIGGGRFVPDNAALIEAEQH